MHYLVQLLQMIELFLAKSHISDISLSPSNLSDGQRVLMWNGKYINVSKVEK